MREPAKWKRPALVACPEILNPESEVSALICTYTNLNSILGFTALCKHLRIKIP